MIKTLRYKKWKKIIEKSGLFDVKYYLFTYPDVRHKDIDPIKHYLKFGAQEGRNPSKEFETSFYINHYKDIKVLNINPLVHYILYGKKEKRFKSKNELQYDLDYKTLSNSELFDAKFYLSAYPDLAKQKVDPIKHYIKFGAQEGRNPNAYFDIKLYLNANMDLRKKFKTNQNLNAFIHFITHGYSEVKNGKRALYIRLHKYDEEEYLNENDDISNAVKSGKIDPFEHYIKLGCKEIKARKRFSKSVYFHDQIVKFRKTYLSNIINPLEQKIDIKKELHVPFCQNPKVSIVIPAYNQVEYTYNTISSIIKSNPTNSYEIIVADDKSPESDARELIKYIKNIQFFTNEENLGFTKNCNKAAKLANGEHILFLNNDTFVLEGWLDSLVELIECDDRIGMVGSKLVYPDGRQQEAGGIIWNDASGWNYGRLDDPTKPEYNYVKEVDYISGASIMIKKDLWQQIGGFDERYAPAYYEDSDLAFEVRKHGYKVMFQPKSIVVHFEGISHGTDTNTGIKAYQVKNKEKFVNKWKDELEKNNFSNAKNLFLARDRSRDKKHILVIDHYVPHYDQDAGSRATWNYIEYFVDNGYKVTFIGDNYHKQEPYTSMLQSKGVEVIYGNHYLKNFNQWFKQNGKYFHKIILSRPHIATKYIETVKLNSHAKIIYYAHDLHFLREQREYEITKQKNLIESSASLKKLELELMEKSDETWLFSKDEKDILLEFDFNIKVVPLFLYKKFDSQLNKLLRTSSDIMFVGGFSHAPNLDGMRWFIQNCWQEIRKQKNSVRLIIAGSKMPEELKKLNGVDNIVIKGYVTDEELKDMYQESKVAIIPLRFGAGVKGKVVEALYNSLPIITTTIGAEGLIDAQDYMKIADTKDDFIKAVLEMLENDINKTYTSHSLEYCRQYFSYEYLQKVLSND